MPKGSTISPLDKPHVGMVPDPHDMYNYTDARFGDSDTLMLQAMPANLILSTLISYGFTPELAAACINRSLMKYPIAVTAPQKDFPSYQYRDYTAYFEGIACRMLFWEPDTYINPKTGMAGSELPIELSCDYSLLRIGSEMIQVPVSATVKAKMGQANYDATYSWINQCVIILYKSDGLPTILELDAAFMDTFNPVYPFGQAILAETIAAANAQGIPYGVYDVVGPAPVDIATKKVLLTGKYGNMLGPSTRLMTVFAVNSLAGIPGILPLSAGGQPLPSGLVTPEGAAKQVLGPNPLFMENLVYAFAGRIAAWRALANDLTPSDELYWICNPMPNAADAYGNPVASKFGAPLLATSGDMYLPSDPSDFDDLSVPLKAGRCTKTQLKNMAIYSIGCDLALKDELVDHPNANIVNYWNQNKNAALLLKAYSGEL